MARYGTAWITLAVALLSCGLVQRGVAQGDHRLGGGANYWVAIDDVDTDDIDDNGLSYFVSYQYRGSLIGLEAQVESLPDLFGEDALAPQAYVILGKTLYVSAGAGIIHQDGEFADDPFFALRAGLDIELLPGLYVDVFGNYRFSDEMNLDDAIDDIDTDTVFLGAAVRLGL